MSELDDINWLDTIVGFALMFPVALWCGYVTSILWSWFLVPTLGVAHLPTVAAAGVTLLVSFMHPSTSGVEKHPFCLRLAVRALQALIVLGMGAIFNLWM